MISLTDKQYLALGQLEEKRFVAQMQRELKQRFPKKAAGLSDVGMQAGIERTIVMLRDLNVVRECDVERFLYLMFTFSPHIAQDPKYRWAQKILFDGNLSGSAKMDRLYERGAEILNGGPDWSA